MFAYVARQAIYDINKRVFGYELLFRNGKENCFPDIPPDEATSSIIADSHLSIGIENLTFDKYAFINFHEDTLLYRFPSTFDPLNMVVEVVESVNITPELVKAIEHIHNLGYKIALDDYDFSPQWEALMPYVRFIKLEVEAIDLSNPAIVERLTSFRSEGKVLIAERVETIQEFEDLKAAGFQYFQGYFLSKPEMVKHNTIEVSLSSVVELVGISVSPDFDFGKINEIFETDVGLSFKLMRFINNPLINKRQNIGSLNHALKYLGEVELKKFIALLAIANLKGNKPIDLIVMSLCRAHFCKLLAEKMQCKQDPPNSFVLGLFSLIDALLDMPMQQVMKNLPFSEEIKKVLCQQPLKTQLAQQYQTCIAFEHANWADIDTIAKTTDIDVSDLFAMYYQSMAWAETMKATFK
ncbi:MAG: EAL domain-containing protein [Glaciecola sp.]